MLERVVAHDRFVGSFEVFLDHYHALHDTHCDGLSPGVAAMLNVLRADGRLIGIVTGKNRAAWDRTCAKIPLEPFDVVITDDDVVHPKPHADGLVAAMRALNVSAADSLSIGDSLLDAQAAHTAGMPFGAALWSKPADEIPSFAASLRDIGLCHELARPEDVIEAVKRGIPQNDAPTARTSKVRRRSS